MEIFLKLFFELSFLKLSEVDDCFTIDNIEIVPNDRIQKFRNYFLSTYVNLCYPSSLFSL